jgi:hypothetical protein
MILKITLLFILSPLLTYAQYCPTDADLQSLNCSAPDNSFQQAHQVLKNNNCLGCHKSSFPTFGNFSEEEWINSDLISNGSGDNSGLVQSIRSDLHSTGSMPKGNSNKVHLCEIKKVCDWIGSLKAQDASTRHKGIKPKLDTTSVKAQLKLYHRCYGIFLSKKLTLDNPGVEEIKSGEKSAVELCMDLFNGINLAESNGGGEVDVFDSHKQRLLSNFHKFHMSWFGGNKKFTIGGMDAHLARVHESEGPAYYITRSLFSQVEYKDIFTSQQFLRGVRRNPVDGSTDHFFPDSKRVIPVYSSAGPEETYTVKVNVPKRDENGEPIKLLDENGDPISYSRCGETIYNYEQESFFKTAPVLYYPKEESGELEILAEKGAFVGVKVVDNFVVDHLKERSGQQLPEDYRPVVQDLPSDNNIATETFHWKPNWERCQKNNQPRYVQVFKNTGGKSGLIGHPSYLFLNAKSSLNIKQTGGIKTPRLFGKAIAKQFLCRELPLLRRVDVQPLLNKGTFPYNGKIQCMQCHSTIDPLSWSLRNYKTAFTAGVGDYSFFKVNRSVAKDHPHRLFGLAKIGPLDDFLNHEEGPFYWPKIEDASKPENQQGESHFYKKRPFGRLYYRSYDGSLDEPINIQFQGIEGLGSVLSEQKDVYACAASRYFEFLTGVKVNLNDPKQFKSELSDKELEYRNYVIYLGEKLYKEQSLKKLVTRIIQSPAFLYPRLGVGGENEKY